MKIGMEDLGRFFKLARDLWKTIGWDYVLCGVSREPAKLSEVVEGIDSDKPLSWSGEFYGPTLLRERVIESQEYNVTKDEVMITSGTNEANFLALMQIVEPGDEVILEQPTWMQAHVLCKALGAKIKVLKLREEIGWKWDVDELTELVSPKTKLIFACRPNNPTGAIWGNGELKAVCDVARDYNIYLLCDEIYRGIEWDRPVSEPVVNCYEKAISTASGSKVLGLEGLRIGWLATQDKELLERCMSLRNYSSETTNCMGELIYTEALKSEKYNKLLKDGKRKGREGLKVVSDWISKSDVFSWSPPAAGFSSFPKYNLKMKSWELCETLLNEPYKTYLLPGGPFGNENHVRLAWGGCTPEYLRAGLKRVEEFIRTIQ